MSLERVTRKLAAVLAADVAGSLESYYRKMRLRRGLSARAIIWNSLSAAFDPRLAAAFRIKRWMSSNGPSLLQLYVALRPGKSGPKCWRTCIAGRTRGLGVLPMMNGKRLRNLKTTVYFFR